VEIYRNNRTAVPRYTLAEAAKLKNPHSVSAATYASSGLVQMRKYTPGVAYNAIFLEGVKGTVLQADLQTALNPILRPSKLVFSLKVLSSRFGVNRQWMHDGKNVLLTPGTTSLSIEDTETALHSVMKPVKHYISTSGVAVMADLCWINREGEISYRESTRQTKKPNGTTSVAPWSKFMTPPTFETPNTYDALTGAGTAGSSKSTNVSRGQSCFFKKEKNKTNISDVK
jgi:transcriptional repressor NF-X1